VDWLLQNPLAMRGVAFLAHALFPAVVFAIGTTLAFRDLLREAQRPRILARTLWVACLVVPLVTAAVVKLLHVPLLLGGVMLIAGVAPGDPFDLVEAKGKKGNLALASTIFPMLVLVMPFTVPIWLALFPTPCSPCWAASPATNGCRGRRGFWPGGSGGSPASPWGS
jgi:predicted Na+-dependent transporter